MPRSDVFVWVGFKVPLIGRITLFEWDATLVRATLVSFVLTPPTHPVLATTADDGTVTLNMGDLSDQRIVGDTSPAHQQFSLSGNGGGSITITFNGATQTVHASKVVANTADSDSDITLRNLDVPITITGGDGNNFIDAGQSNDGVFTFGNGNNVIIGTNAADTITVGDGNNTIIDGDGGNIIIAGNGNNYVASGAGADTITVGTGNNVVVGGKGNNTIQVGSGNNIVVGGQATSVMTTFVHSGTTYTVYGPDGNGVISNTTTANDGDNLITLSIGNNIVLGGSGSDHVILDGGGDNFIVADLGSVTLATDGTSFLSNWAANGPASVISTKATTNTGGSDFIDAQTASGDNVIMGGAGADTLLGGAGTNIIMGDTGSADGGRAAAAVCSPLPARPPASATIIVGGASDDVLFGNSGNDSLSGGAGNDIMAGGDATVVRDHALGAAGIGQQLYQTRDGSPRWQRRFGFARWRHRQQHHDGRRWRHHYRWRLRQQR
ncbi:MAG: calcium-binding protein [Pseudolabrys sp.]